MSSGKAGKHGGPSKNDRELKRFGTDEKQGSLTGLFRPIVRPEAERTEPTRPASAGETNRPSPLPTAKAQGKKPVSLATERPSSAPPHLKFLPRGRPPPRTAKRPVKPLEVDAVQLAVKSFVDRMIRWVIHSAEQDSAAIQGECRHALDALVTQIEFSPPEPKSAMESLKKKRRKYDNKQTIVNLIDADVAQGATAADAVKRLRTVSGYEHVTARV